MTNLFTHNQKPVEEVAEFIREQVQASSKSWWQIALAFTEAQEMYGSGSDSFRKLMRLTAFSRSKVSKLITIATSDRLKAYSEKLSAVLSWGTLYAITTLNEEQFQKLKEQKGLDDANMPPAFISQNEVEAHKRVKSQKSLLKNFAIIQIDEDALRGNLITGDDWALLNSLLNEVKAISEYVTVKETTLVDKEAAREAVRLQHKAHQIARREFLMAIEALIARHKRPKHQSKAEFLKKVLPMSREELELQFNANPREAFSLLGLEYREAEYYKAAQQEITASADRYANNVFERVKSARAAGVPLEKALALAA